MMTRHQREDAYAAVGVLRRAGQSSAADAISQALADLHEYQVGQATQWLAEAVATSDADAVKADPDAPSAPEVYTYWVVYTYREMSSGTQVLGACRHERSTPVLTCEDRYSVAHKIANDMGCNVVVISTELMANEVEL